MGSRVGYRVRDKSGISPVFRKQWMTSIRGAVDKTWKNLLDGKSIDDGSQAIRDDLSWHRVFACLVYSIYEPPFQEVCPGVNCDISDNGLIEVDINHYKYWKIYHIEIDFDSSSEGEKTLIAEMKDGKFKWLLSDEELSEFGEGLG